MHHLVIDDHAGCAHDTVTHDVAPFFNLAQGHRRAFGPGRLINQAKVFLQLVQPEPSTLMSMEPAIKNNSC